MHLYPRYLLNPMTLAAILLPTASLSATLSLTFEGVVTFANSYIGYDDYNKVESVAGLQEGDLVRGDVVIETTEATKIAYSLPGEYAGFIGLENYSFAEYVILFLSPAIL
jgi:hypothetical protein